MIFEILPTLKERQNFYHVAAERFKNTEIGVLGKSILSSEIHYYKIGNGKRRILVVGAHHGMEHISAAAIYNAVLKISENLTRSVSSYGVNLRFLLQKFTFWFVPCINPDGVDMAVSGAPESPLKERQIRMNGGEDFSSWQANARGVDLNHNYDFRFAEYKRSEAENGILPGKTRYSGEYPESEPETHALVNLIRVTAPELILSFHTQGEEVYFRPRLSQKASRIAKACAEILGYKLSCPTGLSDFGGLSDYAGEVLGITSLTVELGRGENPLSYSQLPPISERMYKLLCILPTLL